MSSWADLVDDEDDFFKSSPALEPGAAVPAPPIAVLLELQASHAALQAEVLAKLSAGPAVPAPCPPWSGRGRCVGRYGR